tara:strand:- start:1958 stop:2671 length:714 start_codon:yes stop_codon:yes gene_type:complete
MHFIVGTSLVWVLAALHLAADEPGKLIFQDSFNRTESQETTDEPGNGWSTNSDKRAQGDKQVDLKEGTLRIFISPRADHAVSVTHPAEFTNGTVALRFQFENPKDSLGLNFADLQFKEVHAGHLFVTRLYRDRVELTDLKTGNMRLDIRTARKAKQPLNDEQKKALIGKTVRFPHQLAIGQWHEVRILVIGDQLSLQLNGKLIGKLKSPGIAHPTKRTLRLSVPRQVVVDDVRIWRR